MQNACALYLKWVIHATSCLLSIKVPSFLRAAAAKKWSKNKGLFLSNADSEACQSVFMTGWRASRLMTGYDMIKSGGVIQIVGIDVAVTIIKGRGD